MDIHKKQNVNKCQTCVVSSKRYDSSGEENKLKVISRRAKKEIDTHTQKRDGKEYSKYSVSYPRTLLLFRPLLTILGLS